MLHGFSMKLGSLFHTVSIAVFEEICEFNFDCRLSSPNTTTMADVNGDGLVDIVRVVEWHDNDQWKVLLNQGNSWSTTYEMWESGFDIDFGGETNVRVADVTGDGLVDLLRTDDNTGGYTTWNVWKNSGSTPDLLSRVKNSQGGSISYDYASSTQFDNRGADGKPHLPFPMWVVSKMTVDNGVTGVQHTNDVTTYSYKNGSYDSASREFRGFGEVDETDPNGAKKQTFFKQDDGLKGMMYRQIVMDGSGNPYSQIDDTWNSALSNGVYTNTLASEKNSTYDGNANNPKIIETDCEYDQYGNVTKKSELGDTSVTGDERYTHNEYAYNTAAWIVNAVKHSYINASNDSTKVSELWNYYDGNSGFSDTPTKGDVTKQEKWLDGGTKPVTTYQYDSFGNKTQETDANNHATSYAYDSTGTYQTGTTNAKGQTTSASYDLGTGNLLSKTDPNGNAISYSYDTFGRISKEIKPGDTSDYPTTQYTYLVDGAAPEGVLVSKREVSGTSATLNAFTFQDGLGRTIQTRNDAEDIAKQIVKDTFYAPNGETSKETVPYSADTSVSAGTSAPPPATKFGDGSAGDLSITLNTTENPIDSPVTASANSRTATVGQGIAFAPNQIVLFHQTQGSNAGLWEYARVESYSGTTLMLTVPLTNTYSGSGNNHAQVRVIPQYNNVTVQNGATWTAKSWNGSTGGIFAFLAKGTVTINGTIATSGGQGGSSATVFSPGGTGGGFRGGQGHRPPSGESNVNAWVGEGYPGPSFQLQGAQPQSTHNGNGAGAVSFNTGLIARSGAGGGNGSSGGSTDPSTGGDAYGTADLSSMVFGGGGGGGGRGYAQDNGTGGGGSGGGIIFINGGTIAVSGAITANGGKGGVVKYPIFQTLFLYSLKTPT
jgi:YD repeat-containing protein